MSAMDGPIRRQAGRCGYCISRTQGVCAGVPCRDDNGIAQLEAAHSPARVYDIGEAVYAQGDPGEHIYTLITGWMALCCDMPDGRRQITRFLLPGALFGIEPPGQEFGHSATAITKVTVCPIARPRFDDLRRRLPALNERFVELLEQGNHQSIEALTVLGQGNAKERIAALLGQLALAAAGDSPLLPGDAVRIPLTQRHIAEATGLTSIHVNRVLRRLREEGVIALQNGTLVVANPRKLRAIAEHSADRSWSAEGVARRSTPPADRAESMLAQSDGRLRPAPTHHEPPGAQHERISAIIEQLRAEPEPAERRAPGRSVVEAENGYGRVDERTAS